MKYHNPIISGFYPDPSISQVGDVASLSSIAVAGSDIFLASTDIKNARLSVNNDLLNAGTAFSSGETGFKLVVNLWPDKHSL